MSAHQELIAAPARPGAEEHARSRHALRFRVAAAVLVLLCLGSLGAALALTTRKRPAASSGAWSQFSPSDQGLQGAQEIADYVAPYYRADPGAQLAVVTVVNLNNPSSPLQVVVPSSSSGSLLPLPPSSTIVYNLCGTGSGNCSIGIGRPSAARLLLIRREALELALYTFKYISGVQTVVAILPPGRTVQGCTGICPKPQSTTTTKPINLAVAFDRQELAQLLDRPLRQTLPEAIPPSVAQIESAPEAELVSVITARGMFSEHVEQAQDGSSVVVLSPMAPQ